MPTKRIEWYDIKTKFKQLLRAVTYSNVFQELICWVFIGYMKLVFFTSRKIFVNTHVFLEAARSDKSIILSTWHNRLMMTIFHSCEPKKFYPKYTMMSLASRHGDGRFVGRIMEKFGFISVLGSTRDGRKASRGIDVGSFKKILTTLKKGCAFAITPDGPRGPSQKINGEVVNIARVSGAGILPISYSTSRFRRLRSWDKFFIPLPFSTLCLYGDEKPIYVAKDADEKELLEVKNYVEQRMNFVQEESFRIATQSRK